MQTEIKIIQYINGQSVKSFNIDLYESVPIKVNKSIIDIKEPERRKSDYTLSIRIPATANNRAIFSNIQNLDRSTKNTTVNNFTPDFNPNLKAEAIVLRNGIVMTRGYLQLTEIPINDKDIEYEVIIIGKLANLFQDLGDKRLSDLDLSEYDHNWDYMNISNSWDNYVIKNGVSHSNFIGGQPTGEGYVYPLIDYGNSLNNGEIVYDFEKTMFPAIYVKQIIDSMFRAANFRYESSFFNSEIFKKFIIPFTGGIFSMAESEVNDRTFDVTQGDYTYTTSNVGVVSDFQQVLFNTIVKDCVPASVNLTTDKIVIQSGNQGFYSLKLNANIDIINNFGSTILSSNRIAIEFYFTRNRGGVITTYKSSVSTTMTGVVSGGFKSISANVASVPVDLLVGDEVYLVMVWSGIRNINNIAIRIKANYQFTCSPLTTYAYGQNVSLNSALPKEVKQKDFLTWIFRMFNLYAVPDLIDPNKLIIEPRDDFYTNEVIDITDKLDLSKDMNIQPMGVLDFRDLILNYKQDKDEYNSKYQDLFLESFGTKNYQVVNDFLTETKKVEVGFSATPLSNSLQSHDRIFSKIRKAEPQTEDADLPSFNIRILIYGGLVATSKGVTLRYNYTTQSVLLTSYPYCGMLDNTTNPTFDLSFAQPKAIYYGNGLTNYTNGNLYNRYWRKTIEEITDKDSKILTAYFKLSEVDFNGLSFQKIYFIDKQYYRLYNISHDLNSSDTVQIEFLKLKTSPPFILVAGSGNGGDGGVLENEELPIFGRVDNTQYFQNVDNVKFRTKAQTTEDVFLNFGSDINFIENHADVYLPDATNNRPTTGDPIIIVKNIHGGSVRIYPINTANLVNGSSSYNLAHRHCVWFVAYKGNWQVIKTGNTGGG